MERNRKWYSWLIITRIVVTCIACLSLNVSFFAFITRGDISRTLPKNRILSGITEIELPGVF